ncbi:MAG: outer membrane beta-barrel protein [Bacteroidales bacterium]|nr:outer membrane beta-barrel protein [Bacteroidales bacterium]MDD4670359.1 outer membrane beta-barrel protein [Bacteroidales bacterium]
MSNSGVMYQLDGKNIKNIELIVNPPANYAKYDAVINITTKKKSLFDGMLLTLSNRTLLGYNFTPEAFADIISNKKRFGYTIRGGYRWDTPIHDYQTTITRESVNLNSVTDRLFNGSNKSLSGIVDMNYRINDNSNISANCNVNKSGKDDYGNSSFLTNGVLSSKSITNANTDNLGLSAEISFLTGQFNKQSFTAHCLYEYSTLNYLQEITNEGSYSTISKQEKGGHSSSYTADGSYFIPFSKKSNMKIEAKFSSSSELNTSTYFIIDPTTQILTPLPSEYTNIDNTINNGDASVIYNHKFGKSAITITGAAHYYLNYAKGTNIDIDYTSISFVPSIKYNLFISKGTILNLSYSRNTKAPSIYSLNPIETVSDPFNIFVGNPDLKQEIQNSVSLSINTRIKKHSLNAILKGDFMSDNIEQVSYLKDSILYTSFQNLSNSKTITAMLLYSYRPTRKLNLSLSANTYYNIYPSRNLFSYRLLFTSLYTIKPTLRLQGNASLLPVSTNSQTTKVFNLLKYGISLAGNSKNQRWNYNITLNNIGPLSKKSRTYIETQSYAISTLNKIQGMSLTFNISYTIGKI